WEVVHLVQCTLYFCRPRVYADRVRLPDYVGRPGDRVRLPADYVGCPDNGVRLLADYAGCPDDSGDLPRARVVWKSTAQTNFRRSMWKARNKAAKTTGSQDPTAWMDYGPVWMRRDYWESLCHRWATGPWQKRSQAAKRNRAAHSKKNVHTRGSVSYAAHSQKLRYELERALTFRELFDRTHKRKGMDDYVSESASTIAETYDRTMANRLAEGSPQLDLDAEAWVDTVGGPRKGRVYGLGDSLDTTPVLSSYASSVAPLS
ncbi:hypothetical protein Taro_052341, partial [Colocasia esculenta]|nr:hypothetical protein [Colocasia esculenta]